MSFGESVDKKLNEAAFQELCRRVRQNQDGKLDLWAFYRNGTDPQSQLLSTAMRLNTVLETFVMTPCQLSVEAADNYAHFLANNPRLREIDLIVPSNYGSSELSVLRRLLVGMSHNHPENNRLLDLYLDLAVSSDKNSDDPKEDWKMIAQAIQTAKLRIVSLQECCLGLVYTTIKGLVRNNTIRELSLLRVQGNDWYSQNESEKKCRKSCIKLLCQFVRKSKSIQSVSFNRLPSDFSTLLGKVAATVPENPTVETCFVMYGYERRQPVLQARLFRHECFDEIPPGCRPNQRFKGVLFRKRHGQVTLALYKCQLGDDVVANFLQLIQKTSFTQNLHIDCHCHAILKATVTPLVHLLRTNTSLKHLRLSVDCDPRTNVVNQIARAIPKSALETLQLNGPFQIDPKSVDGLVKACHSSRTLKHLQLSLSNYLKGKQLEYLCSRLPEMILLDYLHFTWFPDVVETKGLFQSFLQALRASPHVLSVKITNLWMFHNTKALSTVVLDNRIASLVQSHDSGGLALWSPFLARSPPMHKFIVLRALVDHLPVGNVAGKRKSSSATQ